MLVLVASISMQSRSRNLTIIHINDTHSHIEPQRSGENAGCGGVIEQAAYVDSVRCADGRRNVLLLHAGDFSQGSSYFSELGGDMEIEVLDRMGFDVVTLGNHEFDNGVDELVRRLSNLKVPVVCANYSFEGLPLEKHVNPYVILRKGGYKIGVIGLLTDIMTSVDRSVAERLEYIDPVSVTNRHASYLKNKKGCDLVICLTHIGYDQDLQLAARTRNVDIIVGGHSHTSLEEPAMVDNLEGKQVVVVSDGYWGITMGNLKISE